jgi:hypothetical protein
MNRCPTASTLDVRSGPRRGTKAEYRRRKPEVDRDLALMRETGDWEP